MYCKKTAISWYDAITAVQKLPRHILEIKSKKTRQKIPSHKMENFETQNGNFRATKQKFWKHPEWEKEGCKGSLMISTH